MAVNGRRIKKANHGKRPCNAAHQRTKRIRTPR